MITLDKEASCARLIPYNLREYLSADSILFAMAHSTVAETCLTYLNLRPVKRLLPYLLPDAESIHCLKYSSGYWGTHAKREFSNPVMSLALELLGRHRKSHIRYVTFDAVSG